MADTPDNQQITPYTKEEYHAIIERNEKSDWSDLEPRERAFAYSYLTDYNHRRAANDVGLGADAGIRYLRRPLVSAFIQFLQERSHIANTITDDFVRTQMLNLLPKLLGQEPVPLVDKDGGEFDALKFHPSESVNLLRELAKSTKFYEGGSGQSQGVTVIINNGAMLGDEEIAPGVTIDHEALHHNPDDEDRF